MKASPSPSHRSAPPPEAADQHDDALSFDDAAELLPDDDPGDEAPPPAVGAGVRTPAAQIHNAQLAAWIESVVERDERALTALYDATLSRVYGLVLRIVRRPALAEEVVEETYFQVWRQAARFDPERGDACAWLLAMARSRAIDALRREARHRHDSLDGDDAAEIGDDAPQADLLLAATEGHVALRQALLQLQSQPRQLVALAFFRGLSHEEIASQTALPLGTVKSQIRRALITLRQLVGDAGLSPTPY